MWERKREGRRTKEGEDSRGQFFWSPARNLKRCPDFLPFNFEYFLFLFRLRDGYLLRESFRNGRLTNSRDVLRSSHHIRLPFKLPFFSSLRPWKTLDAFRVQQVLACERFRNSFIPKFWQKHPHPQKLHEFTILNYNNAIDLRQNLHLSCPRSA